MSNTYFTADLHLGHGNIIKFTNRPFVVGDDLKEWQRRGGKWHDGTWKREGDTHRIGEKSISFMNTWLVENINDWVGAKDTLWVLGDVILPTAACPNPWEWLDMINCKNMHLVWGNHDPRNKMDPKGRKLADFFKSTQEIAEIKVNGQRITLCHYAMAIWNKSHRGSWHLYGHSHSEAEEKLDKALPGRRSMDVGVDNAAKLFGFYKPLSFEEVKRTIGGREGSAIDHHVDPNTPEE